MRTIVGAGSGHRDSESGSSPAMVGRGAELAQLVHAALSQPAVTLVQGEAGIGKTRLVQELLVDPRLAARRTLIGRGHPLAEPFPLGAVIEALHQATIDPCPAPLNPVVGTLRPLLPEIAHVLPPLPPPLGDPGGQRHRVFRALRELLGSLGPCVCVLEDLHWADQATLEFLVFLVSAPSPELTLILTYRGEELHATSLLRTLRSRVHHQAAKVDIELAPLSRDEVCDLVCCLLEDESIARALAGHVHEQTAGIPFAVHELMRLLAAVPGDRDASGGYDPRLLDALVVPRALRDVTLDRVGRLSARARATVEAAAVVPGTPDELLLRTVAGLTPDASARAVSEALAAAVLWPAAADGYGFRHPLARRAVYAAIPVPRRRGLHLRAAKALERRQAPPATLAEHYKQARRSRDWVRHAEAAADQAGASFDHAGAVRLLGDVLREAQLSLAARGRIATNLGRAAWRTPGDQRASVELLAAALEETSLPPGARGELRLLYAALLHVGGDAVSAHRERVRALTEMRRRPDLAAQVMLHFAGPWMLEVHECEHLRWLVKAVDLTARQSDPALTFTVRCERATVLLAIGHPEGWRAVLDIPGRPASIEGRHELRVWVRLAGAAFHIGHYGRAADFLRQAADPPADHGLDAFPGAQTTRLLLDWATGSWDGLQERARTHAKRHEFSFYAVAGTRVLGLLCLATGRRDEARRWLEQSFTGAASAGTVPAMASAAGALARLRLDGGDARGALEETARALAVIKRKGIWAWAGDVVPVATRALLVCGDVGQAHDLVAELDAHLVDRDAPMARAALTVCRAELARGAGRHQTASGLFARARRQFAALPHPYEAAHAQANEGLCLLIGGQPGGAEALFGALASFERLGASFDASQTRRSLRVNGVTVSHPGSRGRTGYGDDLSPREQEVVRLAAKGLTNAEIADVLVISSKTVEHHVASALRKLGVATKRKLVGLPC